MPDGHGMLEPLLRGTASCAAQWEVFTILTTSSISFTLSLAASFSLSLSCQYWNSLYPTDSTSFQRQLIMPGRGPSAQKALQQEAAKRRLENMPGKKKAAVCSQCRARSDLHRDPADGNEYCTACWEQFYGKGSAPSLTPSPGTGTCV